MELYSIQLLSNFLVQSLINFKTASNTICSGFHGGLWCICSIKQHCKTRKGCRNKPVMSGNVFDLFFRATTAVESHCPRVVSCADVVAIVPRDTGSMVKSQDNHHLHRFFHSLFVYYPHLKCIHHQLGGPRFRVQMGRRPCLWGFKSGRKHSSGKCHSLK